MTTLDPGLRKVASALFFRLDTPLSLSCDILMRNGEWAQLATKQVDPHNYSDSLWGAKAFSLDSQACNFLRKSPLLPGFTPASRKSSAEKSFDSCETQCAITNHFLRHLQHARHSASADTIVTRLASILDGARDRAKRILGRIPDDLNGRFGPGTSFELKGSVHSTYADKLWITPHVTPGCSDIFEHEYWRTHWGRTRLALGLPLPATSRGNRFTTVPKDATKDRGICIEPLGNLWVQLGVGSVLKRRLSSVGLHVGLSKTSDDPCNWTPVPSGPKGQDFHVKLAEKASLTGEWATIDLSNASDTVCLELVRWILPPDWFQLLYACRSPLTFVPGRPGRWVRLEKFSSMGNGATFELETLVFAVLIASCCDLKIGSELFVYGDDILLPNSSARDALAVLQACGFEPNARKSFHTSPFRESCGGDFFAGVNVRSCYADSSFTEPTDWIVLHNQLKARGLTGPLLKRVVDQIPTRLRLYGPAWLGDRVLHGRYKPRRTDRGIDVVAVVVPTLRKESLDRWGKEFFLTLGLLGAVRNGSSSRRPYLTPRGAPSGYRIRLASVS